jgi:hypothetical protein
VTENAGAYFFPQDSAIASRTPELLDMLPTQSREVIVSIMRKASSQSLNVLKSLYPKADLDAMGECFIARCSEEEAKDLVQSFLENMTRVIEMIMIDIS